MKIAAAEVRIRPSFYGFYEYRAQQATPMHCTLARGSSRCSGHYIVATRCMGLQVFVLFCFLIVPTHTFVKGQSLSCHPIRFPSVQVVLQGCVSSPVIVSPPGNLSPRHLELRNATGRVIDWTATSTIERRGRDTTVRTLLWTKRITDLLPMARVMRSSKSRLLRSFHTGRRGQCWSSESVEGGTAAHVISRWCQKWRMVKLHQVVRCRG